ncbi:MAG TPA: efflux RND transporter permease subunit [Phycisphaerae bacterium]|nr:efflux RND transporter permease subunit [Phycisphaerae bacterium]HNU46452.1 efflux RND transporter permease subunit [Phycisphaerae bacterium]
MGIIRFAIENPVKVAVSVILVALFGVLSVFRIPIQLTPDVDRPVIIVTTTWPGASPQEVETEIVDRQEDQLKSVTNLTKMTSTAQEGYATVRLEFPVGVDRNVAYRDVSDKLRQVTDYPDRAKEPTIAATEESLDQTIAWLILYSTGDLDVTKLKTFVEEKVKPVLERAEGVADVPVYGGLEREIQVVVDPYKLAARKLTFGDLAAALQNQNRNISAGTITQGKRDYTYRTVGEYRSLEDVSNTVIAFQPGGPVYVRDVATVVDGFAKQFAFVRSEGRYVIAMPARREIGANVITAMENLKEQVALVNKQLLEPRGLKIEQIYDQTDYIWSSINLVLQNIAVGGALAVIVLLVFLRSTSATGIVAVAIPISVVGSFLVITVLGRSLNVVMLAGMAFAVGMVVDNSIVVLENIYRHRSLGKGRLQAALDGAHEVWGAVLASTLTTVAVFLPVITVEEEAGQLFRDIAIAIAAAVSLSLLVSVLVIPPLSSRFLRASKATSAEGGKPWVFALWVGRLVGRLSRNPLARVAIVVGLAGLSLWGSWLLAPATEYLPAGNQNLVFGMLFCPPGYAIDEYKRMAALIEDGDPDDPLDGIRPFWEAQLGSAEAAELRPVQMTVGREQTVVREVQPPPMKNFFYVAYGSMAFMGCTSEVETVVKPLEQVMQNAAARIPGVFAGFRQISLFASGESSGNTVDLEIRGDDINEVSAAAGLILGAVMQAGYEYPQPSPANFDQGRPEVRLVPKRTQAAELGMSVASVGFVGEALVKGAYIGEFNDHGDKIDMVIKVAGTENASPHELAQIPVYTPAGRLVTLAAVVNTENTTAPQEIRHIEEMSAVRLSIQPKMGVPLQETMRELEEDIIGPLRARGLIGPGIITNLAGTADKLTQTLRALLGDFRGTVTRPRLLGWSVPASCAVLSLVAAVMLVPVWTLLRRRLAAGVTAGLVVALVGGFFLLNPPLLLMALQSRMLLALVVTYLLMAALFESFVYPLLIMFTVPLAAVGGFAGLAIVHWVSLYDVTAPIQQLDVVTMLGFVILIGVVVNNAILIVHQALTFMRRDGMPHAEAVVLSVQTRTRPIFMSSFTSIVGMLPLVITPGAGSELYRGLGSVMVGGLLVATLFTLVLVPLAFTLFLDVQAWAKRTLAAGSAPARPAPVSAGGEAEPAAATPGSGN